MYISIKMVLRLILLNSLGMGMDNIVFAYII